MKTKINIIEEHCDYLDEDLNDEIDFSNGIPNPYYNSNKVNIELAPDIAFYFKSSAEVNNALRILIHSAKRINTVL